MISARVKKLFFLTKLSQHFVGAKNFYIINTCDESFDIINKIKNEFFTHHLYFFRLRNSYFTIIKNSKTRRHFDRLKGTNYVVLDFFDRPFTHTFVNRILSLNDKTMFLYGAKCSNLFCDIFRFHKLVYLEKTAYETSKLVKGLQSFKIKYASTIIKPCFINILRLTALRLEQLTVKY